MWEPPRMVPNGLPGGSLVRSGGGLASVAEKGAQPSPERVRCRREIPAIQVRSSRFRGSVQQGPV